MADDVGIKAKMPDTLAEQLVYPLFPEPTPPAEAPASGRPVFVE